MDEDVNHINVLFLRFELLYFFGDFQVILLTAKTQYPLSYRKISKHSPRSQLIILKYFFITVRHMPFPAVPIFPAIIAIAFTTPKNHIPGARKRQGWKILSKNRGKSCI